MRNNPGSITKKLVGITLFLFLSGMANLVAAEEAVAPNSTQLYINNYYSPWTSDENPPFSCRNKYLMDFMQCSGSYCDTIAVGCEFVSRQYGSTYWTPYFSEEGTHRQICKDNYFMTGFHCKGRYCDNLSIQCTNVMNTTKGDCHWTGWFSEEFPSWKFTSDGYYAAGLSCSGSYCDNKNIYACKLL